MFLLDIFNIFKIRLLNVWIYRGEIIEIFIFKINYKNENTL